MEISKPDKHSQLLEKKATEPENPEL